MEKNRVPRKKGEIAFSPVNYVAQSYFVQKKKKKQKQKKNNVKIEKLKMKMWTGINKTALASNKTQKKLNK